LFGRWRPYTNNGSFAFTFFNLSSNDHLSLPSGDVAIAFAFSSIAASFFENRYWKVFCYFFAALTFLGRIYHDQHWLSDVILGAFISTIIGMKLNLISKKEQI
jgi:membrane-associated phospholipid phosphatase